MNPEYSPNCGSNPATMAYAIPWGIAVKATLIPATKSENKKLIWYFGSQSMIGRRFFISHFLKLLRTVYSSRRWSGGCGSGSKNNQ